MVLLVEGGVGGLRLGGEKDTNYCLNIYCRWVWKYLVVFEPPFPNPNAEVVDLF